MISEGVLSLPQVVGIHPTPDPKIQWRPGWFLIKYANRQTDIHPNKQKCQIDGGPKKNVSAPYYTPAIEVSQMVVHHTLKVLPCKVIVPSF